MTGQLGHPEVGTGPGRSRPAGAERRVLSHRHGVGRGEGSQLGDKGPFWTLRRTYEQNTGKERGRVGRHGHHLLDGAQPPGQCHPRTGGASCSQPPDPRVSGSTWGGAVSSGLCFRCTCLCICTHTRKFQRLCWACTAAQGFLQLRRMGAALLCAVWAPHCSGFSCWWSKALAAWAPAVVALRLSCCDVRAPGHAGFSSCGTGAY